MTTHINTKLPSKLILLFLLLAFIACKPKGNQDQNTNTKMNQNTDIAPPKAKKVDHQLTKHNDVRNDPYYWLNQR